MNRRKWLIGAGAAVLTSPAWAQERNTCYMEDFGIKGDFLNGGSYNPQASDNSPAWNDIMARAKADKIKRLILPEGAIGCNSPLARLPDFSKLVGTGSTSSLVRNFAYGGIFLPVGTQYSSIENVSVFTTVSGGIAIGHMATATDCSYRAVLRDIVVSSYGGARWDTGIRIDGLNGPPHYGSRAHTLDGILIGNAVESCGIMLAGVNGVSGSNIIVAGGTWGLWMLGNTDNPCNSCTLSGAMNCSILTYSTNNLSVYASALGHVITDNYSNSNSFYCNYVSQAPDLYGANNHLYTNGMKYSS